MGVLTLKRKIEDEFENWLKSDKGLIVDGARQVGKSFSIKSFLDSHFENVIYLDLIATPSLIPLLADLKDTNDFILKLSSVDNISLDKENTVIFIDEVQKLYSYRNDHKDELKGTDILTLLKYLIKDTPYRLVFSGSLLGIEIHDVMSYPQGSCIELKMYPLDFEEFLWANGVNEKLIEKAKESFINKQEIEDFINEKFTNLFYKYLLIGGMPEAVKTFINTNSLKSVELVHNAINSFILKDITTYSNNNEKLKIKEIYRLLPSELNSKSKRFNLSDIESIKRSDDISLSFTWLTEAGVAIPVNKAKEPTIPLLINEERKVLKLFHEDVGLLTYLYFNSEIKQKILLGEIAINYGSIVENAVAELLYSHGFDNLFYYNSKKYGEIDFLIEYQQGILPIEIKSGKDYKRHHALNNILDIKNYDLKEGYIFYNGSYKKEGNIHYFPIYMIDFLRK